MTRSTQLFVEDLYTALLAIKSNQRMKLHDIKERIGKVLGRNGESYVGHLLRGNIPSTQNDLEQLTCELIRLGGLDRVHCERLLRHAGISNGKETSERLLATLLPHSNPTQPQRRASTSLQPFRPGIPISEPWAFFGREREVRRIFTNWQHLPMSHFAIVGQRSCGKTSLLRYLWKVCQKPVMLRPGQSYVLLPNPEELHWIWVDFQDPQVRTQFGFLKYLLKSWSLPATKKCTIEYFLQQLAIGNQRKPTVILIDEFDTALNLSEFDDTFWLGLRALLTSPVDPQITFCISTRNRFQKIVEMSDAQQAFCNLFYTLELGPLSLEEALELIASSPAPFGAEDDEWILQESRCWPNLLQILCQERFYAIQENDSSDRWQREGKRRLEPYHYLFDAAM